MTKRLILLAVLVLFGCSSGGDGGNTSCTTSADCPRAKVCDGSKCKAVSCTAHPECALNYSGTFCWLGYDADNPAAGVCSWIECKEGSQDKKCPAGYECYMFLCFEGKPECESSSQCKQPAEKCYNNQCVLKDYCELDADCPSGQCTLEEHTCVPPEEPDVIDDPGPDVTTPCDPKDFTDPVSYLCAPCTTDADCGCGEGSCVTDGESGFCSTPCGVFGEGEDEKKIFCPSGYMCQDDVCRPLGGSCKGCILPPGCTAKNEVCNFKSGECQPKVSLCGPCQFDYECDFGNRCLLSADGSFTFYAPECNPDNFSCPKASGCEIRDDGLLVCVYNNKDCCYGVSCEEECLCEEPTPVCDENFECVQCLYNGHCPPGKPVCDLETNTCIIQCLPPTPVYWVDPETEIEYCVECAKSLDCPPGMLCGTFKNDPTTYHKCYYAE